MLPTLTILAKLEHLASLADVISLRHCQRSQDLRSYGRYCQTPIASTAQWWPITSYSITLTRWRAYEMPIHTNFRGFRDHWPIQGLLGSASVTGDSILYISPALVTLYGLKKVLQRSKCDEDATNRASVSSATLPSTQRTVVLAHHYAPTNRAPTDKYTKRLMRLSIHTNSNQTSGSKYGITEVIERILISIQVDSLRIYIDVMIHMLTINRDVLLV